MVRRLVVILGDQLDAQAQALRLSDPQQDLVWMAEVREESTHVPSSKARTVLFLSAMRHFAQTLSDQGWRLDYQLAHPDMAARARAWQVNREPRFSDHAPFTVDYDMALS